MFDENSCAKVKQSSFQVKQKALFVLIGALQTCIDKALHDFARTNPSIFLSSIFEISEASFLYACKNRTAVLLWCVDAASSEAVSETD